ncbi:MAG TPA: NTP transferase domain-containing protein [Sphingomicrobium sp.]|nr:NTP transferase domain-containing protein [Sphingomicrobium sp.]
MTCTAIVLAGSRPGPDAFAASFGTDLKALIPVAARPMVAWPVAALLQSSSIGQVVVLAQQPHRIAPVLPDDDRIVTRRSKDTIAETILALVDEPDLKWPLLVTTADHVLLTSSTIDDFCKQASASQVAIGVVVRRALLNRLPATRRTWLKFRGDAYTGANLFFLASPAVRPAIEVWRSVEQDRKKAWRVVSLTGPFVLLMAALRLITLDQLLSRLSDRLALKIRAIRLTDPLAGVDVDKPADHELVEAIIAGKA